MDPAGFEPAIPAVLSMVMLGAQQSCACEGDVLCSSFFRKSR